MMPDEVRRLPKEQAVLLIRGAKPLLLQKITPEEHPSFKDLKYCKAIEHIPAWKTKPVKETKTPVYQMNFNIDEDIEDDGLEPTINLNNGIDCSTLKEITTQEI